MSLDFFFQLCDSLIRNKRYTDFEDVCLLGMLCPMFNHEEKLYPVSYLSILYLVLLSSNSYSHLATTLLK